MKNLKKLGIVFMSAIMLSSITPWNAMNANASRRSHSRRNITRVNKRRRKRVSHRRYLKHGGNKEKIIVRTKVIYRSNDARLQRVEEKLNWLRGKLHAKPSLSNLSLLQELRHSNSNLAHRLDMSNAQLNHYRKSFIYTNSVKGKVKKELRQNRRELRELKANIPKEINHAVNQVKYSDTMTLNKITAKDKALLKKVHVSDMAVITRLINQDNQAQQKINTLQKQQQKSYKPANVPKIDNNAAVIQRNNTKMNNIVKKQPTQKAKKVVSQIRVNHSKKAKSSLRQTEKIANSHPYANNIYVKNMMREAKIIKEGISAHNKAVDINYVDHMKSIEDFNKTNGGKSVARQAKKLAKKYDSQIRHGLKEPKSNKADDYINDLLNVKADKNNSVAQERVRTLSFNDVYKTATKQQKAQLRKLKKYVGKAKYKKYLNAYNNKKKRRKSWKNRNQGKWVHVKGHWATKKYKKRGRWHKKRYWKRGYSYYESPNSKDGLNLMNLKDYKGAMSKLGRLKAKKQTKAIKLQEQQLYQQTKADRKHEIKLIQDKINQISDKQAKLQAEYKVVQNQWKAYDGHVQMRMKLQTKMDQIQKQITKLKNQLINLEGEAETVEGQMAKDAKDAKALAYHHLIFGNIKTEKSVNTPKFVRISAPTYYFDNLDITNTKYREMKVQPDKTAHRVIAGYQMTLTDGVTYTMYDITSNDPTEAGDYDILAKYTTPTSDPMKTAKIYNVPLRHYYNGAISHDTDGTRSLDMNAAFNVPLTFDQHVKVLGKVMENMEGKKYLMGYQVQQGGHEPVYVTTDAVSM